MKYKYILFGIWLLWMGYIAIERKVHVDVLGCNMHLPKYHYVVKSDSDSPNYYIKNPLSEVGKGRVIWQRVFKDSCEAKIHFFKENTVDKVIKEKEKTTNVDWISNGSCPNIIQRTKVSIGSVDSYFIPNTIEQ